MVKEDDLRFRIADFGLKMWDKRSVTGIAYLRSVYMVERVLGSSMMLNKID